MTTPRDLARDADVRRQQLEAMHERLVEAVRDIRTGDDWRAWLDVAARFHTYSFRNVILIAKQRPNATKVAGYTTWKELGRQVNKGEKGIEILAPIFRRPTPNQDGQGTGGDIAIDEVREARRGRLVGVRRTFVWDISQTSGPDLPKPPEPQAIQEPAPAGLWDELADQVTRADFTLHREPLGPDEPDGYTHFRDRRVVVAMRLGPAEAVLTLAHEVAHMLMHAPSDFGDQSTSNCRGVREVEAESVAYLVTAHHGLSTDTASFPYVATWAHTTDRDAPENVVQETGQRVVATTRLIIGQTTQRPGDDAAGIAASRDASRTRTISDAPIARGADSTADLIPEP